MAAGTVDFAAFVAETGTAGAGAEVVGAWAGVAVAGGIVLAAPGEGGITPSLLAAGVELEAAGWAAIPSEPTDTPGSSDDTLVRSGRIAT